MLSYAMSLKLLKTKAEELIQERDYTLGKIEEEEQDVRRYHSMIESRRHSLKRRKERISQLDKEIQINSKRTANFEKLAAKDAKRKQIEAMRAELALLEAGQ